MNGFKWCFSLLAIVGVFGGSPGYGASILTLTTNPVNGAISGAPGQTVGWGFTLANSSDSVAVITSADFCGGVISSPCSTPLGTFTDFIAQFNFTVVNPHASVVGAFNPIAHTGIGSYAIKTTGVAGSSFLGQLVLTYDTFADSNFGVQIGFGDIVTSAASVSVPGPVPENSSLGLLSASLVGLYLAGRRWRKA